MSRTTKQSIRIIAGTWRGRKLNFPNSDGLRPSLDQVRETLFNWLQNDLQQTRVLDLFAGSGALGFEALSRGAKHVTLIDQCPQAIDAIQHNAKNLQCEPHISTHVLSIPSQLHQLQAEPFDIIFLDPPYALTIFSPLLLQLKQMGLSHQNTFFYIEASRHTQLTLPEPFAFIKHKKNKRIQYGLVKETDSLIKP